MSSLPKLSAFLITLLKDEYACDYSVRAVDVSTQTFKHRMTFSDHETLADVFSSVLVRALEALLCDLNQPDMVRSLPDEIVDLQGLVLGRVRILVATNTDGRRTVSLRFSHFVGQFQNAFADRLGLSNALADQHAVAEASAFLDVVTPILNIASAFNNDQTADGTRTSLEERMKRLHMDTEELRFYVELLRRHTEQQDERQLAVAHLEPLRLAR